MPIYAFGLVSAPWVICKSIDVKKLVEFIKIFKKVEKEFKSNEYFIKSITYNTKLDNCYIAKYDSSKTNIETYHYQQNIESMINKANEILSKKHSYDNYKFDIMGTWVNGRIIIMEKK